MFQSRTKTKTTQHPSVTITPSFFRSSAFPKVLVGCFLEAFCTAVVALRGAAPMIFESLPVQPRCSDEVKIILKQLGKVGEHLFKIPLGSG